MVANIEQEKVGLTCMCCDWFGWSDAGRWHDLGGYWDDTRCSDVEGVTGWWECPECGGVCEVLKWDQHRKLVQTEESIL